ncbi:hypothetical protein PGB90_003769 [Kerria lacca]
MSPRALRAADRRSYCCAAYNCANSDKKEFRMHSFPICNKSNAERRNKWIIKCRRKNWTPTKSARLCEFHFKDSQYKGNHRDGWKKLKQTAIPTIFHFPNLSQRFDQERKSLYKGIECTEKMNYIKELEYEIYKLKTNAEQNDI